jgi:hypothetical protein
MAEVTEISQADAKRLVQDYDGGQFFTVTFVKRGDGSLRTMNCRKGVVKDTNGNGHKYDPASKDLICVRDVQKREHRMIALDTIRTIRMRGVSYKVSS